MRAYHRVVVLVAAGTLAVSSTAFTGASASAVSQNLNVSQWLGNQNETAVAVNPTDPNNVVIVSNNEAGGPGLLRAFTSDGGATWTGGIIANGDQLGFACCDGSLSFDQYGNLFLTYLKSQGPGLPVALSTDGGATFTVVSLLEHESTGSLPSSIRGGDPDEGHGIAPVDQPTIVTGPGSVWATYKFFGSRKSPLRVAGAPVTGFGVVGDFLQPANVPDGGSGTFGDIAVGPDGQVMVVYQNHINGEGPSGIFVNVDPDGLGPQPVGPRIAVGTTSVGGFDYIAPQPFRSVDAETGLAWDRSAGPAGGRVWLVYTDEFKNESDNTNVMLRYSDDDGGTWSPPIRVNDDGTHRSQFLPKIALDQTTGDVGIAWYDARNDDGQGVPGDTDGRRNTDAQLWATFVTGPVPVVGSNFQVSAGTSNARTARAFIDFGDYIGVAFEAGTMWPAWADNSNSTGDSRGSGKHPKFEIYTAAVALD